MAKGQSDITQRKKSASPSSAEYKKKGFKEFMYDKDEGTFFGRTGSSWGVCTLSLMTRREIN